MKKDIICLGGLPGGGKSTVRYMIADKLGWEAFSTGDFVRGLALKRGMTLDEFNAHTANDKDTERLIDAELERIEAEGNEMVVDSHLAFHFVPSGFKVFFDVSLETSAKRIFADRDKEIRKSVGDTMESIDEAKERIQARIDNHNERYMKHYGIAPYQKDKFDFIVNTEAYTPEEVADIVIAEFQNWRVS